MVKGKRPAAQSSNPWGRWLVILAGLAVVAGIVWWATRPDEAGVGDDVAADTPGNAPRPLDLSGAPTVENAAVANVDPDSLVSMGPEVPSGVDASNDPRLGDRGARVTIVELSDFQCPFCARFHTETFPALRRLYGDQVQWVYVNRYFPQHQHARAAAIAAECAHRQGRFWEYAERLFADQENLGEGAIEDAADEVGLDGTAFAACRQDPAVAAEVDADTAEGDRLGVDATPTFIVNGQKIMGAQPVGVFNEVIGPYFAD